VISFERASLGGETPAAPPETTIPRGLSIAPALKKQFTALPLRSPQNVYKKVAGSSCRDPATPKRFLLIFPLSHPQADSVRRLMKLRFAVGCGCVEIKAFFGQEHKYLWL